MRLDHPPLLGPLRVTSRFGYRTHPVTGAQGSYHNGVDLAAPVGTPVYACGDGEVVKVNTHDTGGRQVVLALDGGGRCGYAHLDVQNVHVGQRVKAGDVVALSGATGRVTGPHLHFTTVNAAGAYVDPMTVIPSAGGGAPGGSVGGLVALVAVLAFVGWGLA